MLLSHWAIFVSLIISVLTNILSKTFLAYFQSLQNNKIYIVMLWQVLMSHCRAHAIFHHTGRVWNDGGLYKIKKRNIYCFDQLEVVERRFPLELRRGGEHATGLYQNCTWFKSLIVLFKLSRHLITQRYCHFTQDTVCSSLSYWLLV